MSLIIRKKKILLFLPLPPPVHGAALRNKSLIESRVVRESFNIEVLPFNFASKSEDIGKLSFKKLFKFFIRAFEIVYKVITFRPDLVYFNLSLYGFAFYRDVFYVSIFKFLRCKLLFHLRTQGVKTQILTSNFKKAIFIYVLKKSHVICLSKHLSLDISDVYKAEPIIVNNGVEDLNKMFVFKDSVDHQKPRILFLSNLARSKGIIELIKALRILKNRSIDFEVSIAGAVVDIPIISLQETLQNYHLESEVKIVGPKYGIEKYNLLRDSDIFVMPTLFEAFPGTILEAMQFGLPVISTVEGAIPEIVDNGSTGFLVEKYDIEDLARKIEILIKDHKMRISFGNNGRKKFVDCYTLEIFEKNMKNAFERVLSR